MKHYIKVKEVNAKSILIMFLCSYNAFDKFLKAVKTQGRTIDEILANLSESSMEYVLLGCFPWGSTEDGFDFWKDLHGKWMALWDVNA